MVRSTDNDMPLQYLWVLGGGTSTPTHNLTVTLTDGIFRTYKVKEGKQKTVVLEPNTGYLPPKTVTVTPAQTPEYDKYTGRCKINMNTVDLSISGACFAIPHTYAEMASSGLTHEELKRYGLTHNELAGVY